MDLRHSTATGCDCGGVGTCPACQREDLPRFRIDVTYDADYPSWTATIYDMADHGPDLAYAAVTSSRLDQALAQAAHYVLVAS